MASPSVDVVSGAHEASYSREVFRRLAERVDLRVLRSKGYGASPVGTAYRLLDHPLSIWRTRREAAILHVDGQLLAYVLAWPLASPKVVTCYDIIPFLPEFDDASYLSRDRPMDVLFLSLLMRGLRSADRIIAISDAVRADLLRLGFPGPKIDVVPVGVDPHRFMPRTPEEASRVKRKLGIPEGKAVVLCVGTEHPRKNVEGLLRAFAKLVRVVDAVLVKVGAPRHPHRQRILDAIAALDLAGRVIVLDFLPDDDLALLYAAADVLVLPSLYEGFGLPPLEAMAAGTPVAVSRVASLPEVVADAGMYFDPRSETEIANALESLLVDTGLRAKLRERGLDRARSFSWGRTVDGILATYGRLR